MKHPKRELAGWGNYPVVEARCPRYAEDAAGLRGAFLVFRGHQM